MNKYQPKKSEKRSFDIDYTLTYFIFFCQAICSFLSNSNEICMIFHLSFLSVSVCLSLRNVTSMLYYVYFVVGMQWCYIFLFYFICKSYFAFLQQIDSIKSERERPEHNQQCVKFHRHIHTQPSRKCCSFFLQFRWSVRILW